MQTMGPRGRGSIAQFERSIADQCIGEKKRTICVHTRQERRLSTSANAACAIRDLERDLAGIRSARSASALHYHHVGADGECALPRRGANRALRGREGRPPVG